MRVRRRMDRNPPDLVIGESFVSQPPGAPWVSTGTTIAHVDGSLRSVYKAGETCYDILHNGPPYLEGGPFNKWSYVNSSMVPSPTTRITAPIRQQYPQRDIMYVGGFLPNFVVPPTYWPLLQQVYNTTPTATIGSTAMDGSSTWGDFSSYGAKAWNKYKPGKAEADAGIFFGEIREIPRMLMTTARAFRDLWVAKFGRNPRGSVRSAANNWLNTQFGWSPFINDLKKFHKVWNNSDKMLSQLVRDNGSWITRGGSVTADTSSEILYSTSSDKSWPTVPDIYYNGGVRKGSFRVTRVTSSKVWFKAQFRYYIPDIESVIWSKKALAQLYGLSINPALLYELTPWSWLIDWFSNVGDVFSNLDNGLAQNLAAKYAYVMGTIESYLDLTNSSEFLNGTYTASWPFSLTRKSRTEANPFGFGLTFSALTDRQWSILSALGITRLH